MKIRHFILTTIMAVAGSLPVLAAWEETLTCDHGVVLDVNTDERRNLQFVIRDQYALRTMYERGQIYLGYGQQEYILKGFADRGVFYSGDFNYLKVSLGGELNADIFRQGDGIKIRFYQVYNWSVYPPDCVGNELSMACEGQGQSMSRTEERGDWLFQNCH